MTYASVDAHRINSVRDIYAAYTAHVHMESLSIRMSMRFGFFRSMACYCPICFHLHRRAYYLHGYEIEGDEKRTNSELTGDEPQTNFGLASDDTKNNNNINWQLLQGQVIVECSGTETAI